MLQARPTLGVCFLSQPYFVPLFWLCLVHVRSAVDFPVTPRRTSLQVDVSRVLYAVYICQYGARVWIHVQVD